MKQEMEKGRKLSFLFPSIFRLAKCPVIDYFGPAAEATKTSLTRNVEDQVIKV